jgi:acetolactate synthase I/II/III large subunit
VKLSDFVAQFLYEEGVRHVFMVSGGAIVHCVDSAARCKDMKVICVAHEQAAGMAADAYWRTSRTIGVAMVTSGPGATNLTTSISNAYFDSIPVMLICGQVTTPRLRPSEKLRQKGFQETDVVSLFGSITKYITRIMDPYEIKYELQKALYIAKSGRPGPVALDIPDDLQRVDIDVSQLREFVQPAHTATPKVNAEQVSHVAQLIKQAKRPVIILGVGVRIADAIEPVLAAVRHFKIPVLLTWGGKDLMTHDDELNMGGLGVVGPRWGNFAAQNADLIITAGTRMSQMITGGKTSLFAPKATKVMIDIDPQELIKFTANDFKLDLGIESELAPFFNALVAQAGRVEDNFASWRAQIRTWEKKYPICPKELYDRKDSVNGLVFVKEISKASQEGDVFITDTGANISWTLQAIEMKKNQRMFSAWNHTPMGYALSAGMGAVCAGAKRALALTGDGGLLMNVEELAVIRKYNLNVKLFIFSNDGHAIQKQTMDTWLEGRYVGAHSGSGLSFPDFIKLAESFHLPAVRINNHSELAAGIKKVLETPGPVVCELMIDPEQRIVPMLKFGAGLEDLNPKLAPEELAEIMKVSADGNRPTCELSQNKT